MVNQRSIKAFTLIELIVVLTIVGLLLAVVPPMMSNVIDNAQVKSATRQLAAGLKYARSKAITSKEETTLSLDVENKSFSIGKKNKKLNLPKESSLTLTTAQSEQTSEKQGAIRFFADGSSTGGQIKISHKRSEFLVDVNWLTGKVIIIP